MCDRGEWNRGEGGRGVSGNGERVGEGEWNRGEGGRVEWEWGEGGRGELERERVGEVLATSTKVDKGTSGEKVTTWS